MRFITKDELAVVLRHALKASRRDHLIILLSAQHGLRRSEVASLTMADIEDGMLVANRRKGSNKTTHPLLAASNLLFDELRALTYYLNERRAGTDLLFPSSHGGQLTGRQIANIVKRYVLAAGLPKELAHPHALKHYTGSYLCRQGMGVEFVKQYLGHKDIKNTCIYLNISDVEASAKAQEIFNV